MSKGKVVVLGSNATRIETKGGYWGRTGQCLNETVVPAMTLIDAGYEVVLATPDDTPPVIDPASDAAYLLTTQDRMVAPSTQRFMATRAKAKLIEMQSSHAAMLSHPKEVAAFIESAAAEGN